MVGSSVRGSSAGHGCPAIRSLSGFVTSSLRRDKRQDSSRACHGIVAAGDDAGFCLWGRGVSPRGRESKGRGRWRPLAWGRTGWLEIGTRHAWGGASPLVMLRHATDPVTPYLMPTRTVAPQNRDTLLFACQAQVSPASSRSFSKPFKSISYFSDRS